MEPAELAGLVTKEAVQRSKVDPKQINYVTVGNAIPTEGRFPYVARVASIQAAEDGTEEVKSRCTSMSSPCRKSRLICVRASQLNAMTCLAT